MQIRAATSSDRDAVDGLVSAAFGRRDEADLVDQLNRDEATAIALVATDGDHYLGHVLLSHMQAPFPALGLAPVSVAPDRQGEGIGAALIGEAIRQASQTHAVAIFVLGNHRYYGRFGFDVTAAAGFSCRFSGPHFAVLPLRPLPTRVGAVAYAAAFD